MLDVRFPHHFVTACNGFVTAPTSRSPNVSKGCYGVTAPVYYIHPLLLCSSKLGTDDIALHRRIVRVGLRLPILGNDDLGKDASDPQAVLQDGRVLQMI